MTSPARDGAERDRVHAEAVVGAGLARKAAMVVQLDRFLSPLILALLAVELVVAIVFLVLGPLWVGLLVLVVAALGPLFAWLTLPKLTAHLAGTGFAPGTRLAADYFDDHVVLSTGGASNRLAYSDVERLRTTRSLAVLRRRGQKVLFLLPVEAVPPEVRPRFVGSGTR